MVMSLFHSVSDLIGHTPLLQLHKLDTGPCSLFLKLENQNPGGSIKDRVALSMINEAERQGKLAPGGTIIEATAGNTGLGLALIAAQKNYRLILVVPDKMSREKIFHLRALGATVLLTRSDVNNATRPTTRIMPAALPMKRRAPFISTSLITTPIRWPMPPPLRRSFISSWRATSTPSSSASAPAARWVGFRPGLLSTRRKRNLFSPIRRVRSLPIRSIPDATAKRDPGWSKGSAKILSRRWPGWRGYIPRIASATAKHSRLRASCCRSKECWPDPPPAPCSAPRCATAGRKAVRNG